MPHQELLHYCSLINKIWHISQGEVVKIIKVVKINRLHTGGPWALHVLQTCCVWPTEEWPTCLFFFFPHKSVNLWPVFRNLKDSQIGEISYENLVKTGAIAALKVGSRLLERYNEKCIIFYQL